MGTNTQYELNEEEKKKKESSSVGVDPIAVQSEGNAGTQQGSAVSTGSAINAEQPKAADMQFQRNGYTESDSVRQAQAMLEQQMSSKPGAYQSTWQNQLNDTINKILNREDFSYDLNADALYHQYKDQYTTQGKLAMMDTMGQAAAMTGGFGNSYAQTVGQQVYQGYLQQLNNVIPELYQMALDKYYQEGQELYNQYSMLGAQEERDYGRYRDQMSDWQTERDYLAGRYDNERNYDYSKYADERDFAYGEFSDDRNYAYQTERDQVADQQWQAEFDEAVRQYNHQNGLGEFASTGGGGGNGGKTVTNNNNNNNDDDHDDDDYETAEVVKLAINQGASQKEVNDIIDAAVEDGSASESQGSALKNKYLVDKY